MLYARTTLHGPTIAHGGVCACVHLCLFICAKCVHRLELALLHYRDTEQDPGMTQCFPSFRHFSMCGKQVSMTGN